MKKYTVFIILVLTLTIMFLLYAVIRLNTTNNYLEKSIAASILGYWSDSELYIYNLINDGIKMDNTKRIILTIERAISSVQITEVNLKHINSTYRKVNYEQRQIEKMIELFKSLRRYLDRASNHYDRYLSTSTLPTEGDSSEEDVLKNLEEIHDILKVIKNYLHTDNHLNAFKQLINDWEKYYEEKLKKYPDNKILLGNFD